MNNLKQSTTLKQLLFLWIILYPGIYISAQPLAGTDDLGRVLSLNHEVGNPKPEKQVAIFYFLWQGHESSVTADNNLVDIVKNHPEVLEDYDNKFWELPPYKPGEPCSMYFWGEPIYGYYMGDDYWVHLRSIQLLTDAGVDFLVIDATNTLVYSKETNILMNAMEAVRAQGKNPPRIVFYTHTQSGKTMQAAYDNFYKKGAPYYHPSCWYYLDGKPLIIGFSKEAQGTNYHSFFSYRESQWPNEPQKINGWPWIEFTRPQRVYKNHWGEREIVNVSVSQHPNCTLGMGGSAFYGNKDNWGRSYHNGSMGNPETDIIYGYNFQEQWDFAIEQDVPFIYITGWNEWIAGRWDSKDGNPEHSWFCDAASPEYSRDAEPTLTGAMKDNYYMQMTDNIRRFKGIEAVESPSIPKTPNGIDDWNDVSPLYLDYIGDTEARNHPGTQSVTKTIYSNNTGRNDFHLLKVARDNDFLYFYAETSYKITKMEGNNWMRLYIDIDRKAETGWFGYDFRIIEGISLQKFINGKWLNFQETEMILAENKLIIKIERKAVFPNPKTLNFEFKWSDNMQNDNDPLDWYINGDAAPGGRFNYIFSE